MAGPLTAARAAQAAALTDLRPAGGDRSESPRTEPAAGGTQLPAIRARPLPYGAYLPSAPALPYGAYLPSAPADMRVSERWARLSDGPGLEAPGRQDWDQTLPKR